MNMPKNGRVETSLKANKKARKVYHKCIPPGNLTGLIKWGDGKSEEYADGSSHTVVLEMNGVEEVDFLSSDAIRNLSFLHKKHVRGRVIPNGSVVLSFCHPERSEGSVYIYFMLTDSSQSSEWQN